MNHEKGVQVGKWIDKALVIVLRGMEAQVNCGIQAMHMQALKGRVPNNQAQYFMQNTNNNLLGLAMSAPNLINGVAPQQPQGSSEIAQLIELAKADKAKDKPKDNISLVKLEKNLSSLTDNINTLVTRLTPTP